MKIMKKNPTTGEREIVNSSGFSPLVSLTQSGNAINLTVTDINGTKSATLAIDNEALVAVATATLED